MSTISPKNLPDGNILHYLTIEMSSLEFPGASKVSLNICGHIGHLHIGPTDSDVRIGNWNPRVLHPKGGPLTFAELKSRYVTYAVHPLK